MKFDKLKKLSLQLKDIPKGKSKHFTFILERNKIISVGWNQLKTHPATQKWYPFPYIHAEFMAILNLRGKGKFTVVNTRVADYGFGLSRPCSACVQMLGAHGIEGVYYTNDRGQFEWLNLN